MSEEALRMVSPVIHMRRTATEDTELNGQQIAKDEKLVLCMERLTAIRIFS